MNLVWVPTCERQRDDEFPSVSPQSVSSVEDGVLPAMLRERLSDFARTENVTAHLPINIVRIPPSF